MTVTVAANASSGTGAFTLTPADDSLVEGDETVGVSGSTANLAVSSADLTLTDDDAQAVIMSAERVSVAEDGGTATYTVALGSQPSADVTVTPSSADESVAVVSGALTFTASDWSVAQTVTVTGVDDDIDNDPDRNAAISHAVSGGDYGGVAAADVTVTAADDDARAVLVSLERVFGGRGWRHGILHGGSRFAAHRRGDGDAVERRRIGGGGLGRADVHGFGLVRGADRDGDGGGRRY